ncbi:DNA/RNA nuclease SfsA [Anaerolentibacter hominis]|uniref:DNA/RNA nuclease SfsA n=1 Tax=Anaerolentibacter hominis TaxID=3079009 RepID=UPI0031B859AA
MKYERINRGIFISRPNRFIARVEINGKEEICHVKNTGRCRELLIPGTEVYVQEALNPERKTRYDLITVRKEGTGLVNMDSQAPNQAAGEWIAAGGLAENVTLIQPEKTFGASRMDFYLEAGGKKIWTEVKGVTLERDGLALFPDAPTLRGVKHIHELMRAASEGFEAYLLFVIQMKGPVCFAANEETHPEFAQALREAEKAGVKVIAADCIVTEDSIQIDKKIPIRN